MNEVKCEKCGHVNDGSLDMEFAFCKLRDLTTGRELAAAINAAGWTHKLRAVSDRNGESWRIQAFTDTAGDYFIAVHNGEDWVAAFRTSTGYYAIDPEELWVQTGLEYLKGFEPNEG